MKKCFLGGSFVVAALAFSASIAGEPLKSGVPVGGSTSAFNSLNVTGPDKGKSLCLV